MLGNVKAFILGICGAVVFASLLVSANTMAMTIRERTREVAVLKTLGFTRKTVLAIFVGEAVVVAAIAGAIGILLATGLMFWVGHNPNLGFFQGFGVNTATMILSLLLAGLVGFVAALFPSYHASQVDIVEGLRYIG
jgi:putative ABC transport system permease protein